MTFTRREGAALIPLGAVICGAGLAGRHWLHHAGYTLSAFTFAVILGAFGILVGLVALTGLLDRPSSTDNQQRGPRL